MDAVTFSLTYGVMVQVFLDYVQKFVLNQFNFKISGETLGFLSLVLGYAMGFIYSYQQGLGFLNAVIFGFGVATSATFTAIIKKFANNVSGVITTTAVQTQNTDVASNQPS